MNDKIELAKEKLHDDIDEDDSIEQGFAKMELLCRSRCVQMPTTSNVTVREIKK